MSIFKYHTFLLGLLLYSSMLVGQTSVPDAYYMLARADGQSIKLRWAPSNSYTWTTANRMGYQLVRHTLKRDGEIVNFSERSQQKVLAREPIRPWPAEADLWRPLMERNDYGAIAAQALYGESFGVSGSNSGDESQGLVNRAQEEQNRFSFSLFAADQSYEVAQAMGLAFVDQDVVKGEEYVYMVYPAGLIDSPIDTGYVLIGTDQQYPLPKVLEVEAEFEDRMATISWNKNLFQQFYSTYEVQRSEDGATWQSIKDRAFINPERIARGSNYAMVVDTFAQNNKPYYYRVRGRTPFEEYGEPSDPVQGMGIDPLPLTYPEISGVLEGDNQTLNVEWTFDEALHDQIIGFVVQRSRTFQGPYETISGVQPLPVSQRFFIDENPYSANYYRVLAVDAYQRELPSMEAMAQLNDETPPARPTDLRGKVMEDGTMIIAWADNQEPDILGYRVYMANNPNREFSQLTTTVARKNTFVDTVNLNTLSKNIYIKVRAYDYRENSSEFSDILTVTRPDTIAPSPPQFTGLESSSEGIELTWANSSSPDVNRHLLQRQRADSSEWETLEIFRFEDSGPTSTYSDTSAIRGQRYHYRLLAVDDSGLESVTEQVSGSKIDNGIRSKLQRLRAEADRRDKKVLLRWSYPELEGLSHFVILRGLEGQTPGSYETIPSEEVQVAINTREFLFADEAVSMNTTYRYRVKVVFADGAASPFSEIVEINY